jgi:hypothetical protein
VATMAIAAGPATAWPWLFSRYRSLRALAISVAAPLALFVWKGVLT